MIAEPVRRYFSRRYPDRARPLARWFRAGEAERRSAIGPWLATVTGSVLDAGCGDGALLASLLARPCETVWLVDVAPAALARARAALASSAANVHAVAGDLDELPLPEVDVAIAFGITDYHDDWAQLVTKLRAAARHAVLVDFARARTPHSVVRRWWLRSHGVRLRTATEHDVRAVCGSCELRSTRLHWIARLPGRAR